MEWLNDLAQKWWPVFALHTVEVSLFILLVAGTERLFKLNVTTRYALWLLALAKVFIPPFLQMPVTLPENFPATFQLPGLVTTGATFVRDAAFNLHSLLFGVWLASATLVLGLLVKRHLQLRQRLRTATPIAPSLIADCEAFETRTITSPLLTGLLRTRLYLPQDWRTWPPQQLQSILQHEAAHSRGRDLWVLNLESAALVLFGLNPLVWLVRRRLTYLRELRCDVAAIQASGISTLDYSKLLYAFAEKQIQRAPAVVHGIAFAAQQSTLYQRLQHLLTRKESEMKTRKFTRVLLLGLLGVAMLMFSWQCSEPSVQSNETPTLQSNAPATLSENGSNMIVAKEFDHPPAPVFFQNPVYPEQAQHAGISADVLLQLTIDIEGNVVKAVPVKVTMIKNGLPVAHATEAQPQEVDNVSSTLFTEAASEAARDFKFNPALLKGKAVPASVMLPIKFKLDQSVGALMPVVNVEFDLC